MVFQLSKAVVGVVVACLLLVRQLGMGATPGGATGRALALDDLVARVQAQYERTTHLHAQFRQEIRVRGFDQAQTGAGQVWILKPGMMRWEYTKPERQTIIANGDLLWVYLPAERQVIRDRVHDSMGSRTPALFLAGQARLTELFAVTGPSSQAPGEEGLLRLELTPKEGALPYAQVQLGVDPRSYQVVRVELVDPLGNVTTMWFSNIDTGGAVDPALFQFQVPPGVDVISPPVFPAPR
jgi:outer membrane lipoprotein carrier protein